MIHVISCFWNAAPYLKGCIDSVKMQSHKDFIMHLIDDQSDDGGADICREAAGGDERFRIIRNEKKNTS